MSRVEESDFVIRAYREGDEIEINRRFNEVFGLERSLAEWHEKFRPSGNAPRIVVCFDRDGDLVAHYGATELICQVGDRRVVTGHAVDSFAIRRRDVVLGAAFVRTGRAFIDHYCGPGKLELMMGFPGLRAMGIGRLKLGYIGHPVEVWRKTVKRRRRFRIGGAFQRAPAPAAADRLWQRVKQTYSPGVARDGGWLSSRYLSAPDRFTAVGQSRGGELTAWAAVARSAERARIVDLVWDGADLRALRRLLGTVSELYPDTAEMEIWTPGYGPLAGALTSLGWSVSPQPDGCHVATRVFDPDSIDPAVPERIVYALGDTDLI